MLSVSTAEMHELPVPHQDTGRLCSSLAVPDFAWVGTVIVTDLLNNVQTGAMLLHDGNAC